MDTSKVDGYENIYSVNHLCLTVNHASGYIKEKNRNKHLIFDDSVNEKSGLLKKYIELWDKIKNEINLINGGKEISYEKDYTQIKFNSDDNLPLNKPLKFYVMTIIVRFVFEEDNNFYPQIYLDECLYEL